MVNYCCVNGCGRNSKTSKHLFYYGLPKDNARLEQWLKVIGREDLLEKNLKKLSYRVCSRHFAPSSIKNKHLCADAVPTLYLSASPWEDLTEEDDINTIHKDIVCNSCQKLILGFRYKCTTCPDYDLCAKCEMFEAHPEHYLLRIPKSNNYKVVDDLITKWQRFVNIEHVTVDSHRDASSDDDIPITKYVKQQDSNFDIPEDVKNKIRNEVTRVLAIDHTDTKKLKRKKESKRKEGAKKKKMVAAEVKSSETGVLVSLMPEVVFADVNDFKGGQGLDVKPGMGPNEAPLEATEPQMPDLSFNDDFILRRLLQD